jgi:hypothetical protein
MEMKVVATAVRGAEDVVAVAVDAAIVDLTAVEIVEVSGLRSRVILVPRSLAGRVP